MNVTRCPNFNHRKTNPPVRFCPNCAEIVNGTIPAKQCNEQLHARARMNRNRYCVHCGEQLIK